MARIAKALQRVLAETAVSAPNVTICLETMAGQGTNLGYKFEHLAQLLQEVGPSDRLGVTFDTCHVFAAGYDIRTPETYAATITEFDRIVGLDNIKTFHFNDSKFELGQKKTVTPTLATATLAAKDSPTSSTIHAGPTIRPTWKRRKRKKPRTGVKSTWTQSIWQPFAV